jgi:hypothetical protein
MISGKPVDQNKSIGVYYRMKADGRRTMLRYLLLLLVASMLVLSCSSNGGNADAAEDGVVNGDETTGGDDDEAIDCESGVTKCPPDKDCLCCGSIGPTEICLCTVQCWGDDDCQGTGFSLCNMAEGAKSGICTPSDFNCCWNCN